MGLAERRTRRMKQAGGCSHEGRPRQLMNNPTLPRWISRTGDTSPPGRPLFTMARPGFHDSCTQSQLVRSATLFQHSLLVLRIHFLDQLEQYYGRLVCFLNSHARRSDQIIDAVAVRFRMRQPF